MKTEEDDVVVAFHLPRNKQLLIWSYSFVCYAASDRLRLSTGAHWISSGRSELSLHVVLHVLHSPSRPHRRIAFSVEFWCWIICFTISLHLVLVHCSAPDNIPWRLTIDTSLTQIPDVHSYSFKLSWGGIWIYACLLQDDHTDDDADTNGRTHRRRRYDEKLFHKE